MPWIEAAQRDMMADNITNLPNDKFPRIKSEILNRLSDEAAIRTTKPQAVDWDEIHRQAAEVRKKV
jgi:hypothetical protein